MWESVTVSEVTPYQIQDDTLVLFVLKGCLATYYGSGVVSATNRLSVEPVKRSEPVSLQLTQHVYRQQKGVRLL